MAAAAGAAKDTAHEMITQSNLQRGVYKGQTSEGEGEGEDEEDEEDFSVAPNLSANEFVANTGPIRAVTLYRHGPTAGVRVCVTNKTTEWRASERSAV